MSHNTSDNDHGNMKSYVIGFMLSLLFTFIPYMLVVNKVLSGNLLMFTIVAFAFLQMIIQITFFLHLGRGPKPNWNLFFFAITGVIIVFVVIASIFIMSELHYNMAPSEQTKKLINNEGIYQLNGQATGACRKLGENYQIIIEQGNTFPNNTRAEQCDTITFINNDPEDKQITFGIYPDQVPYAGEIKITVENGKNETITLSEYGTFQFYDINSPDTTGYFTITPK